MLPGISLGNSKRPVVSSSCSVQSAIDDEVPPKTPTHATVTIETTGVDAFERGGRMDNFSVALQHLKDAHDKKVEGKR